MAVTPGMELMLPVNSMFWELRRYWASGRRVSCSLTDGRRLEGHVSRVSATDACAEISGVLFGAEELLAVHNPAYTSEDTTYREGETWHGRPRRVFVQDEELPGMPR